MQYMGNYLPLYENSVSEAAFLSQEAGYHFEKYLHTDIDVYLIGSGKCSMDIAGQSVCCAPKDFVMISPYTVHSFSVPEDEECSFYHIQFSPRLFSQIALIQDTKNPVSLIHSLLFRFHFFHRQAATEDIRRIVPSVIRLYNSPASNRSTASAEINVLLLQLLIEIFHYYNGDETVFSPSTAPGRYISFTMDFIEKNYEKKILIQDIASCLHISARHLGKIFSSYMHMTLGSYINIYRIHKAIGMMEDPDLSLTEIAGKIGLKDSQHFSKLFLHVIGTPPSQYRKQFLLRKNNPQDARIPFTDCIPSK